MSLNKSTGRVFVISTNTLNSTRRSRPPIAVSTGLWPFLYVWFRLSCSPYFSFFFLPSHFRFRQQHASMVLKMGIWRIECVDCLPRNDSILHNNSKETYLQIDRNGLILLTPSTQQLIKLKFWSLVFTDNTSINYSIILVKIPVFVMMTLTKELHQSAFVMT